MIQENVGRSLKERQREERENLILQVAEELLLEKGYAAMTMDEVASRVGISKGAVYLHFPTKEELIATIRDRNVKQVVSFIETAKLSSGPARAKMEAILTYMCALVFGKVRRLHSFRHANGALLSHPSLEGKGKIPEVLREQVPPHLAAIIEEGKANGEFDRALPTGVMVAAFQSLINPIHYEPLLGRDQMPVPELTRHLADIYFTGIAAKED